MSEELRERHPLSPERRALLDLRLKDKRRHAPKRQSIARGERTGVYPLAFEQERLWFLHLLDSNSLMHNLNRIMTLEGPLDVKALQEGFDEVVRRHEILRTTIALEDGRPVQIVAPARQGILPLIDLSGLPTAEAETRATELATQQAREPFDMAEGPLMRAALLRVRDEKHALLLTIHHVVTDWWSFGVLYRELATLYRAFSGGTASPLSELPIQYGDYARWQRERLQGRELDALLSYWKKQLSGAPQLLSLPAARTRPAEQTFHGRRFRFEFPKELYQSFDDLGRAEDATAFMTTLAVFQVLLYRYTAQEDILVGTPSANRSMLETESLIGFLLNTLVLRGDMSGDPTFRELLSRMRRTILGAYAHQDLPFQKLVEEVRAERNLSVMPLVQVCFIFLSTQAPNLGAALPDSDARDFNGLDVRWTNVKSIASEFDLTLALENRPDYLDGFFEYNTDLFDEATIGRMVGHLRTLMEAVALNPDRRIAELPLLTEEERSSLLHRPDGGTNTAPVFQHVHQLFEAQTEKTPDATAVVFKGEAVSYRELNERANRLAHYLRLLGVGPEVLVGILLERSVEMVVGLLAVLKAGGAYLPLDPSYPTARLALMLEDARIPFVLTQEGLVETLDAQGINVVRVDAVSEVVARQSRENPVGNVVSDNLAYVIYTSGSTGIPKGVQITHGKLSNFLNSMLESPGLTPEDVVLAVTTISFDPSTLEIFLPLLTGARLILVGRDTAADGRQLLSVIERHGVTVVQATPTTWRLMLEAGWPRGERLKILSGGEALQRKVAAQLLERSASLWNMYGPTETTVWSHVARLAAEHETHLIGRPVANAHTHILDKYLRPVPFGVVGEIYIGGGCLARGYLRRPGLTAERFIPHPFSAEPGARLYKTGDLACYLPGGQIEFKGRSDRQVKVRGHRIELGEIESALSLHEAVRGAAVLVREDASGECGLVAYVVAAREMTTTELREYLKRRLPEFMLPSVVVWLDAMPLTASGKTDLRALPAPGGVRPELAAAYVAPQGELEKKIAAVWQSVLGIELAGVRDNFFDLGGNSLLFAQVSNRLSEELGREISLIEMFEHPTVGSLAQHLSRGQAQDHSLQQAHQRAERRRGAVAQQTRRVRKTDG